MLYKLAQNSDLHFHRQKKKYLHYYQKVFYVYFVFAS